MCLEDNCPDGVTRRSFFGTVATTVTGLAAIPSEGDTGQDRPQAKPPETRVLDDPSIQHGRVVFKHGGVDSIDGFLARPKAEGTYPAVLVIAGNRITEEYIPNTCAALAVAGFVGLAPNVFHPLGDAVLSPEEMRKALANHTELDVLQDVQAGADYLRTTAFTKPGAIGVLGFCFGGRIAMLFGARNREVEAVVAFHPGVTREADVVRLKAPVQIHHGTADRAVSLEESERLVKILKAQRTHVELFAYQDADHGFLAYTRPYYRPDYAKQAWARTTKFLKQHLK